MAACQASGKRLPARQERLGAARGTLDSGCNVSGTGARVTNAGGTCQSAWGAQDMIGNVWEWTDEWYASLNGLSDSSVTWPGAYSGDGTFGVTNYVYSGAAGRVQGLPAAALRGGNWPGGAQSGVFALNLGDAPSNWDPDRGFRCVSER